MGWRDGLAEGCREGCGGDGGGGLGGISAWSGTGSIGG